ncbi:MAG TPA: penicillin-binding protein 2 [Thermoleophilia bacterium]|nr:penicillin-binding protein 2 [Thermoleophilia bacterium]HQG03550.1 penicillin-binding protein 2 [Thermoleophilia bacterium]HQG54687.1 penicillin-binding protein 2 [Thermoleophilia bacterium]HQJ98068.1 penicillin-binding protein 2 [Thermoleophilia bacterium]
MALRVALLAGLTVVLVAVILFRLWYLQVLSGAQFEAQANDNRLRSLKVVAPRGAILDRDGRVLVENRPGLSVGVRPMDVTTGRLDEVVSRLADVLKVPEGRIRKKLRASTGLTIRQLDSHEGSGGYDLVIVAEDVTRAMVSRILERKALFPGVEVRKDYIRAYPMGTMAAQVLGHLGEISREQLKERQYKGYAAGDVIGQGGVESTYDRWLRGRDGVTKIEVDAMGRPKSSEPVAGGRLPEPGDSLVLTLDADVQKKAEAALRYGIELAHRDGQWAANGGAAVVMDVRNGQLLGLASYPTFDPAVWTDGLSDTEWERLSDPQANQPLVSKAFQGVYAAGSTFKAIDAVAALEEGVIVPSTRYYCNGRYPPSGDIGGSHWNCWTPYGHGSPDLVAALAQSCDVYFYNVGYAFYNRPGTELADWAKRFGLGRTTGLDVPGEVKGLVPTPEWREKYFEDEVDKLWKPGNSILLAIGQGDLQVTPLQMAVAYAAIANGGTVVQPHLGLKVVSPEGKLVRKVDAASRKVAVSGETLSAVRAGLRAAATEGTSAAVFASYPVAVAGKTGTAEVYGKGDYAWYASYAPADDPKYVVVVLVEQGGHGGTVAAPAARMIYDALFHLDTGQATGATSTD